MASTHVSRKTAFLFVWLALVAQLFYVGPLYWSDVDIHTQYRHTVYIPLVLAAFWFGLRGGLVMLAVVIAMYVPQLCHDWCRMTGVQSVDRFVEIVMFVAVTLVTGYLAESMRQARKRAEYTQEELENAYADLSAKTSALFLAERELQRNEPLRTMGELSSELAHEIGNPLGTIKGTVDILSDRCGKQCGNEEFVEILKNETQRLIRIVNDFLGLATPRQPETDGCDARKAFDSVAALLRTRLTSQGVELEIRGNCDGTKVSIPPDHLKQVYINLLLNAIQAMHEKGTVAATFQTGPDFVCLTLCDDGPGVEKDVEEHIFDPFFSTRKGGTGLGLSVCRRILTRNGGSIRLMSRDETRRKHKGACFELLLPVAKNDA
jgi:two-component system sensor histidine kinase HydH